jgi:hypothetical protein
MYLNDLHAKFHWPDYGSLAIAIQTKATHTHLQCHYLILLLFNENITLTKVAHIPKKYYLAR